MESGKIHSLKYIGLYIKGERMNNKERDEKFLKSWLKKKISITTSTVVSFLITGAVGGAAYGANTPGTGGGNSVAIGTTSKATPDGSVAVGTNAETVGTSGTVAVGSGAKATGGLWTFPDKTRDEVDGVAIGKNAVAKLAVSVGPQSFSKDFGVSIGYKAGAENTTTGFSYSNVAIGSNTRVGVQGIQASQGIAIGSGVKPGEGAWAKGDQSISIGANTTASGDSSIAIWMG